MEDNQSIQQNTKFFSFNGIIGRRDFLLNIVGISSISIFFTIPYITWLMTKISTAADYFAFNTFFAQAPIFLKFWYIAGMLGVCILTVSNIFRRMNDINGKVNIFLNIIVSIICIAAEFTLLMPIAAAMVVTFLSVITSLILVFKKGALTAMLPYDYRKEFNWGAFFGTWIWGLFNKSFIPLLYIVLFFTPWSFLFQLYCGLKGNEWAYKNKKWNNVKKFNKSQENQALFWLIFTFIIIPVVYFVLCFTAVFSLVSYALKPENSAKVETTINKLDSYLLSLFTSHSIEENENKFYIEPEEWNSLSFDEKLNRMDVAAGIASRIRTKEAEEKNPKKLEFYSKTDELPRTKIYSSTNSKLLGEYVSNNKDQEDANTNFMKLMKEYSTSYRFYNAD